MPKQPYMPFYLGDYIQDTRILPLAVRGAWVDILLNMWKSPERGVVIETYEEYARMLSCTLDECKFALNLLMQKKTCDYEFFTDGRLKLISRRMVRDNAISLTRSESGKNGVKAKQNKKFAGSFAEAKAKQNTEYDNNNDIENENVLKGVQGENTIFPIEHCSVVAMNDPRWVKASRADPEKLADFNRHLEKQATYQMNPAEYKKYFSNWITKKPFVNGNSINRTDNQGEQPAGVGRIKKLADLQ